MELVKNEIFLEEKMNINNLEEELIDGLKIIPENDRDLKSLTIWCNLNHINGSDSEIKNRVKKILLKLQSEKKLKTKKKTPYNKRYVLFSLV